MKNFTKIKEKLNKATIKKLLSEGKMFMVAYGDELNREVRFVESMGIDFKGESWVGNYYANSRDHLKKSVLVETIEPYYAFKYKNKLSNFHCCDIDINRDYQDIISVSEGLERIVDVSNTNIHPYIKDVSVELYISIGKGDFPNFGGPLELEFLTDLMVEKNFYNPEFKERGVK